MNIYWKHHRAIGPVWRSFVLSWAILIAWSTGLQAQGLPAGCDYTDADPISVSPSGGNISGATALYLLTDVNGTVVATANTSSFAAQSAGLYQVYGLFFDPATPVTVSVGDDVSSISLGGSCAVLTDPLDLTVCPSACDVVLPDSLDISFSGGSTSGFD